MPRHAIESPLVWLQQRIDEAVATRNVEKLAFMFREILDCGDIDNDTVQDAFQTELTDDGYYYDLESDPIDEANPKWWSIDDCVWFLENRLNIQPPAFRRPYRTIQQYRDMVQIYINEYEEPEQPEEDLS